MIKGININVFNVSSAVKYMFWFQLGYVVNSMTKQKYNILILSVICIVFLFLGRNMYVLSLLLVAFLYYVMPDKEFTLLTEIDKHSYGIYLHSPLIYITYTFIPNENPLIVVGVNFFLWGSVAYLLTNLIKSTSLNRYLGI